ncbi:hypothetical protein ACS0TY_014921 [Phlomoides rotata]
MKGELINWVHERARLNDMIILIKRSDNADRGGRPSVMLAYEISVTFRDLKKASRKIFSSIGELNVVKEREEGRMTIGRRSTGIKKTWLPIYWELKVVRGTHNHPISQFLEGHMYVGRLTPAQDAFVLNFSMINSPSM